METAVKYSIPMIINNCKWENISVYMYLLLSNWWEKITGLAHLIYKVFKNIHENLKGKGKEDREKINK